MLNIFKKKKKHLKLPILHTRIEELKTALENFKQIETPSEEEIDIAQKLYDECQFLMDEIEHAQNVNDKEIENTHDVLKDGWWATSQSHMQDLTIYNKRKAYFDEAQSILSGSSKELVDRGAKKKEVTSENESSNQPNNG